jgi:hypothetical protein
VIEEQT